MTKYIKLEVTFKVMGAYTKYDEKEALKTAKQLALSGSSWGLISVKPTKAKVTP